MTVFTAGRLDYEGVSFLFGDGTPYPITNFQRGSAGWRVGDRSRPTRDGRVFGRDRKDAPAHELSLLVVGDGDTLSAREASVRERVGALTAAWNAPTLRSRIADVAELTIGDRSAIGRPRGVTPDDTTLWDGSAEPSLKFEAVNDLWYGTETSTRIAFVPESTGGLPVPAAVPFVLGGGSGEADSLVQVGGDHETYPVLELHGPIRDPWVDVPGVGRLMLSVDLAYDEVLTVDARPWRMVVLRNGVPVHGVVRGAGVRLSDLGMVPGSYRVIFGGHDPSGGSWLTVRVRPAWTSL